jgi:T4 RnlA family RNA ligase
MKINVNILNEYYEKGLLNKQTHPSLPLTIWNYSEKVQYEDLFDDITLQCRGLVTDEDGEVVACPFKKFFNIEEGKHIPTPDFTVKTKLDGSLGILFNYKGEWLMATRGSFTSEQAIKGFELLQKHNYKDLPKDYTFLLEIIYPENRIVCQYNFEDVIMLGMINTKTGDEHSIYDNNLDKLGFTLVKRYDGIKDYSLLKEMIKDNEEGFVVSFSNGSKMKIKGVEYIRLHKIMTNISTTGVWEVLSSGSEMDELIKDVPDEFYNKIKDYVKELRYQYHSVKEHAGKMFDSLYESYDGELPEKKKYAEWVKQFQKHLHPILFRMYDNKDYSSYIWKLIKPEFRKL